MPLAVYAINKGVVRKMGEKKLMHKIRKRELKVSVTHNVERGLEDIDTHGV